MPVASLLIGVPPRGRSGIGDGIDVIADSVLAVRGCGAGEAEREGRRSRSRSRSRFRLRLVVAEERGVETDGTDGVGVAAEVMMAGNDSAGTGSPRRNLINKESWSIAVSKVDFSFCADKRSSEVDSAGRGSWRMVSTRECHTWVITAGRSGMQHAARSTQHGVRRGVGEMTRQRGEERIRRNGNGVLHIAHCVERSQFVRVFHKVSRTKRTASMDTLLPRVQDRRVARDQ